MGKGRSQLHSRCLGLIPAGPGGIEPGAHLRNSMFELLGPELGFLLLLLQPQCLLLGISCFSEKREQSTQHQRGCPLLVIIAGQSSKGIS